MVRSRRFGVAALALCALGAMLPLSTAAAAVTPKITITVGTAAPNGATPLTFTVADPDTPASKLDLSCQVDGDPVPCRPGVTLTYYASPGSHGFSVKATDPQGGTDKSGRSWDVADLGSKPHAYVKRASNTEWAYLNDGTVTVSVTFGVVTGADIVSAACTLNGVTCQLTQTGAQAFRYEGRLPAGNATLVFRAVDTNARVLTARRHFWTTFPALSVAASPVVSRGGVPVAASIVTDAGASLTCKLLDGTTILNSWAPCPKSLDIALPTNRAFAAYVLKVKAKSATGTNAVERLLYVDRVAPKVAVRPRSRLIQFPVAVPLAWGITNTEPLSVRYQAQTRRSEPASALGDWANRVTPQSQRQSAGLARGAAICVRARATDRAGNVSGWSNTGCRVRPLDERDLKTHGHWNRFTEDKFYAGTGLWASSAGSSLSYSNAAVRSLVIWGRKGPYGGRLAVIVDGKRIDTVSMRSKDSGRAVVYSHTFASLKRGTIELRIVSAKQPVTIDAVGVSPFALQL